MRIDDLINKNFDILSDNDLSIAKNVIVSQDAMDYLTLQEFAESNYTSKSSVIRFAQKSEALKVLQS